VASDPQSASRADDHGQKTTKIWQPLHCKHQGRATQFVGAVCPFRLLGRKAEMLSSAHQTQANRADRRSGCIGREAVLKVSHRLRRERFGQAALDDRCIGGWPCAAEDVQRAGPLCGLGKPDRPSIQVAEAVSDILRLQPIRKIPAGSCRPRSSL